MNTTSPWKALLWKEWRESWMVAALAVLAILLACGWDLSPAGHGYEGRRGFHDVMQRGFLIVVVLSGVGLGLLQALRDTRADAWGFSVHRAVSRATCFWAKILVGGGLLVTAWTVAMALLALWCVWPGIPFVPFLPESIVLGVIAQAAGLAAYAAGIAVGVGNGRWWLTRWFPLLPAALVAMGATTAPPWIGLVLASICTTALVLAGRAYWIAGPGAQVRRGGWLTTGPAWVVAVVTMSIVVMVADGIVQPAFYQDTGTWHVDEQGRPLMVYQQDFQARMVDEHGAPVAGKLLCAANASLSTYDRYGPGPLRMWLDANHGSQRLVDSNDRPWNPPRIVVVALPTRAEVIAYDRLSMQRIPWQTASGPLMSLPGIMRNQDRMVIGPDMIWEIHEERVDAEVIFRADPAEHILSASRLYREELPAGSFAPQEPGRYILETDRRFIVQQPDHADVPVPRWAEHTWGSLAVLADGRLASLCPTNANEGFDKATLTLHDATGQVVGQRRLVRPPGLAAIAGPQTPPIISGLSPLAGVIAEWVSDRGRDHHPFPWPAAVLSSLLHAIALIIVIRRARRHAMPRVSIWRWATIVGLVGWPGLLVFWTHADLPPLVACPSCSSRRSLAQERCHGCGAPWPDPQRIDTMDDPSRDAAPAA